MISSTSMSCMTAVCWKHRNGSLFIAQLLCMPLRGTVCGRVGASNSTLNLTQSRPRIWTQSRPTKLTQSRPKQRFRFCGLGQGNLGYSLFSCGRGQWSAKQLFLSYHLAAAIILLWSGAGQLSSFSSAIILPQLSSCCGPGPSFSSAIILPQLSSCCGPGPVS